MTFTEASDLLALPLDEVAKGIGREYGTVLAYRHGKRTPTPEVMSALARFMVQHSEALTTAAAEVEKAGELGHGEEGGATAPSQMKPREERLLRLKDLYGQGPQSVRKAFVEFLADDLKASG